ncbi:microtubule-associated protein 1B-like [Ctenocephalides felis]|uniref:microtubule-associated protein 1B-like n=1 Tax=Ctenocephalides felis TaxID=7515 RepID=UPI000E6E2E93|nr:microtubule-associated protein 1B-like [Ctenocephalides felis]
MLLQHLDYFTESEQELLKKGFENFTDDMIRKLLKCDFISDEQKAFLLRQLLLRSNKISDKTRKLLECGGALTKEAIDELRRLGLLTLSQLYLLDGSFKMPEVKPSKESIVADVDKVDKESLKIEQTSEKELKSEMLSKDSDISRRSEKRSSLIKETQMEDIPEEEKEQEETELTKEPSREPSKQLSREPSKQLSREPSKQLSREPSKQLSREPSKQLSKQPSILSGQKSGEVFSPKDPS